MSTLRWNRYLVMMPRKKCHVPLPLASSYVLSGQWVYCSTFLAYATQSYTHIAYSKELCDFLSMIVSYLVILEFSNVLKT